MSCPHKRERCFFCYHTDDEIEPTDDGNIRLIVRCLITGKVLTGDNFITQASFKSFAERHVNICLNGIDPSYTRKL